MKVSKPYLPYLIIVVAVILGIFVAQQGFTAPSYGTDMPRKGEWVKALETNIVFKRKLDKSYGKFKSEQYFLDLSYGVSDWIVVDLKIGLGNVNHKPTDSYGIDYDAHFAGGYGFRVRVFDSPGHSVKGVLGFQHISVHLPAERIEGDKNKVILDDWQISALISKDFRLFTPYLGAKLSRSDLIHKLNGVRKRKKSGDPFVGLIVGAHIRLGERFKLNIEGRVVDETALSARISCPF